MDCDMRIGQGIDVHPLEDGRPLVLGGVRIPFEQGLSGDTDGDVLTHALMDAILGALALGDLGTYFRADDPAVQGASSVDLLTKVIDMMRGARYRLHAADMTVIAQAPRLSPHTAAMRDILRRNCGCLYDQISVKATTTDFLGPLGRSEGMMAMAVVLLVPAQPPGD